MTWIEDNNWRPLESYAVCSDCCGKGINRKKRKQKCPHCSGSGRNSKLCGVCYKNIKYNCIGEDKVGPFCECEFNSDGTIFTPNVRSSSLSKEIKNGINGTGSYRKK